MDNSKEFQRDLKDWVSEQHSVEGVALQNSFSSADMVKNVPLDLESVSHVAPTTEVQSQFVGTGRFPKLPNEDNNAALMNRISDLKHVIKVREEELESEKVLTSQLLNQISLIGEELREKDVKVLDLEQKLYSATERYDTIQKELHKVLKEAEEHEEHRTDEFNQAKASYQQNLLAECQKEIERVTSSYVAEKEQLIRHAHQVINDIQAQARWEIQRWYQEFVTTLGKFQRAAQENCARHQQQESRSWLVSNEVEVNREKILGSGAFGKVYKGTFRGTPVAVKELHEVIISAHNNALFEREMQIASRLRHENVVLFMAATLVNGIPLIVTEYANGGSLASVLKDNTLQLPEVVSIALDVAQGILYLHLHPHPVLHRDIKPDNVLIFERGLPPVRIAKISDLGAANLHRRIMTPNPGTPLYAAPETKTEQYTSKADVYSFGLLVLEMCVRECPVPGEVEIQVERVDDASLNRLIKGCIQPISKNRLNMQSVVHELGQRKAAI